MKSLNAIRIQIKGTTDLVVGAGMRASGIDPQWSHIPAQPAL